MKGRIWSGLTLVVLLTAIILWGYQRWRRSDNAQGSDVLALMPGEADAVFYADFAELRQAPFIAALYAWAPKPQVDADYAQFLRATGFNYERDLDRAAVALLKKAPEVSFFAVADGRFDRKKIAAYVLYSGALTTLNGREIFSVPVNGGARKISFIFLRPDEIAITNDSGLSRLLSENRTTVDVLGWRMRFKRLAGSPVFAVIRKDAGIDSTLTGNAPGELGSPQLSALLDQLPWITVAGKPDGDRLRVVMEGECTADATARQLSDVLNGVLVLAQAGLNGSNTRKQLDPAVREAYLELVKGADVSRIDRGETKAVRLVFDVTPKFLEAARTAGPIAPLAAGDNPAQKKMPPPGAAHHKRK